DRLEESLTALAAADEWGEVGLTVSVAGYRAAALNRLGRSEEALAALHGLDLDGVPADQGGLVLWQRGVALQQLGRSQEALVALDGAVEAFGGKPSGALQFSKAQALIGLGRLEEALTALSAAGESGEVGLTVMVYRALALNRLGRSEEALTVLRDL